MLRWQACRTCDCCYIASFIMRRLGWGWGGEVEKGGREGESEVRGREGKGREIETMMADEAAQATSEKLAVNGT